MKTKMGRPKLPKGDAKSEMIRARVTPMELKTVLNAAKKAGADLSEWARQVLLKAAEA
jgi:hypothetical protein